MIFFFSSFDCYCLPANMEIQPSFFPPDGIFLAAEDWSFSGGKGVFGPLELGTLEQ